MARGEPLGAARHLDGAAVASPPDAAQSLWQGPTHLWLPVVLFLITVALVSPVGDFPLNDDWVYGTMVRDLVEQHRFIPHPYAATNAVGQVFWAALLAAPSGFSFTVLRLSTLVLGAVAIGALMRCGRELGLSRAGAVLAGLLLFCNPIFLNLCYTFMTDVPFLAPVSLSVLFYLRALRTEHARDLCWGSAFAAAAFYVRQFGVLVSLAFVLTLLTLWLQRRERPNGRAVLAFVAPWVVAGIVLILWKTTTDTHYIWSSPDRPELSTLPAKVLMAAATVVGTVLSVIWHLIVVSIYAGLLLLPISVARFVRLRDRRDPWTRRHWRWAIGYAAVAWVFGCGIVLWRLPLMGNILRDLGTGPLLLQEVAFDRFWGPVRLGSVGWYPITLVAISSAALLVTDLRFRVLPAALGRDSSGKGAGQLRFLLLSAGLLMLAPFNPWLPIVFDRYFLPGFMLLGLLYVAGLKENTPRAGIRAAFMVCAVFCVFSLVSVQDYMAWNRARWAGIDRLQKVYGAHAFDIDGGFEYNGMYTSPELRRRMNTTDFNQYGPLGWWTLDNAFAVAFKPREGFDVLEKVPYFSWLGFQERHLLLLQRKPGVSPEMAKPVRRPTTHDSSASGASS